MAALLSPAAHAIIYFNAQEVDGDILLVGSGSIDLTGAVSSGSSPSSVSGVIYPDWGWLILGPATLFDYYTVVSGPSFGAGSVIANPYGTGDHFGIMLDSNRLVVPVGYTSGAPLSGSTTFPDAAFADIGLSEGVYTWTFGSGENTDSIILTVGNPAPVVPEPTTYALLGGVAALGFAAWRRRRA
ncbi:MAG: PEP-CTERM sorting domain-containing protein [Verrucomicrobiota bacterium JB022]|nr:PEP-CTERM sorting domain-containing protein [Verrucomicrobiota bacterium JB022]